MNILFEWIFEILKKWIIFLNEYSGFKKKWIFFWMNILDFVLNWILNWIIFRPNSMKKWIFKTYRTGLVGGWGTMVAGVFDCKDRNEGDDFCRSNWIMIITMTSSDAWNFLKKKNRDILNSSQMPFPHQRRGLLI